MNEPENIPRHKLVGFAFEQYESLGLDWRFPCNPTFNELCDRAELAGYAPLVVLAPKEEAQKALDETVKSLTIELSSRS